MGVPQSLASRTQHTICHSSAEGELMALGSGLNESIHIMQLIKEVQHGINQHIFDIPDHTDP